MARSYTFRLTSEGVDQLQKELEALGPAGKRAFEVLGEASQGLSRSLTPADAKIAALRDKLQGLQQQLEQTKAAKAASEFERLSASAQRLADQYDPLGAAQRRFAENTALANRALASGALTIQQHVRVLGGEAAALAQAEAAARRHQAAMAAGAAGYRRFTGTIQQAGYQIGDFAVQIASGQDPLRAFIQQGTQLISMFGPWGAVIGAAGAVVGALATSFLGLEDATDKATEAQDAYNKSLETGKENQKAVTGEIEKTIGMRRAELKLQLSNQEAAFAAAKAEVARQQTPTTMVLSEGGSDVTYYEQANEASASALANLKEQERRLLEFRAIVDAAMDDYERGTIASANLVNSGTDPAKTKDQKAALDEFIASLQKDAELAGLSGLAHARRQAILQAEAAATRDGGKLTDEQRAKVIALVDAEYQRSEAIKKSAEAQSEADRQAKARTKATDDATRALQEQIYGLQEETYQLGLSDRERFVRQQVLKAEQQVLKGAIQNGQEYVAQVEAEAYAQFDAAEAVKKRTDAERDATREAEKQAKEREKIAEREAEMMLEPFKNAIQGIQSAGTDMWQSIFGGKALNSAADFFGAVKQMGIRWAAEMASLVTFRPAVGSILGAVAPGLAASMGFGGSAAAAQNAGVGGIGSGGFGSFAVSAAPLAAMFGGAGGATSGLGSWLFGAGAPVMSNGIQIGTSGGGLLGSMPGLAGFLNSGLGTGAVGALLSAGVSLASGGSALQAGISGGGALLGGLAGSVFGQPVLGAALGGIAGNIISSLFGGKEKKPPKQQSITNIEALASGYFGTGSTFTKHTGDVTSTLGNNATNAINAFLASIGGTVSGGGGLGGQLLYYGRTPRFMSSVGGQVNQYGADAQGAEDAVADFIARTMVNAAKSDRLEGVSEAVKTAIANSGAKDAEALDAAVAFGRFYDRLDKIRTPADAAAKAMADLAAEMAKAQSQAEEYGLAVEKLPEIFRQNFTDDIADQTLQLTDPTAYALKQLEIEKAAALAQATQLGADINQVEELYGLKRQAIVEQGLRGVSGSFQAFFDSLLTDSNLSALSPQEQYKVTRAAFEGASNDNLIAAATPFLQASRGMNASSKAYADDYRAVLERIKAAGGLSSAIPFFAKGGDHSGGWMVAGEQGPELIASGAARVFDAETTAAIMAAANADLSPKLLAQIVKSFGRGPDTELAHVMPEEIVALKAWGGAGTLNPHTGLPEFGVDSGPGANGGTGKSGSSNSGGGKGSAGGTKSTPKSTPKSSVKPGEDQMSHSQAQSAGVSGSANAGKGNAGGTNSAFDAAAAAAAAAFAESTNLAGPNPGDIASGGIVGPNGYLGQGGVAGNQGSSTLGHDAVDRGWAEYGSQAWQDQQQKVKAAMAAGISPQQITQAAEAYAHRLNDYSDRYNTFGEDVGNFLASWLGFNEIAPTLDFNNLNWNADWGFDPAGLIGGTLFGGLTGIPIVGGVIADWISRQFGRPLEMNLGPDVLGGVPNALAVQGASDIALGGASIAASETPRPAGGILASGDIPRSLSSLVNGASSAGSAIKAGLDRTAGGSPQLDLVAKLLMGTNDKLDRLLNAQALTNDALKQNGRGTNKII